MALKPWTSAVPGTRWRLLRGDPEHVGRIVEIESVEVDDWYADKYGPIPRHYILGRLGRYVTPDDLGKLYERVTA